MQLAQVFQRNFPASSLEPGHAHTNFATRGVACFKTSHATCNRTNAGIGRCTVYFTHMVIIQARRQHVVTTNNRLHEQRRATNNTCPIHINRTRPNIVGFLLALRVDQQITTKQRAPQLVPQFGLSQKYSFARVHVPSCCDARTEKKETQLN